MTEHTYTHTHCSLCACVLPCFSGARLFADAMDCSPPGSSLHGDSLGKCWRGLPCPPLGDLYDPGMEPASPATPALQADSFLLSHPGRPHCFLSVAIPHIKISGLYLNIAGRMKMEKANETFRERILTIKIPKITEKPRIEITI